MAEQYIFVTYFFFKLRLSVSTENSDRRENTAPTTHTNSMFREIYRQLKHVRWDP